MSWPMLAADPVDLRPVLVRAFAAALVGLLAGLLGEPALLAGLVGCASK